MAEKNVARNRRGNIRHKPRGKVKIVCYKGTLDLGKNLAVALQDISEGGTKLVLNVALDTRQEVLLLIESIGHHRPIKVSGTVAWVAACEDGLSFLTGIRFHKYLPYEDVARMS